MRFKGFFVKIFKDVGINGFFLGDLMDFVLGLILQNQVHYKCWLLSTISANLAISYKKIKFTAHNLKKFVKKLHAFYSAQKQAKSIKINSYQVKVISIICAIHAMKMNYDLNLLQS